ncbi:MAG TPA: glycosyltransferase [Patescibacteria group bacterium]|nr:glycosyltransferase [Patescibacteria group bacterium]
MMTAPFDVVRPRRVAIVHDWLTVTAGAERVLEQLLLLYPDADLYSLVDFLPTTERGWLGGRKPITSFIQRLPFARSRHRAYLPLMPFAVEQWDFSGYDLVISSCYAVVKGLLTGPDQLHVSYVHSPMRYAWDLQDAYLRQSRMNGLKGWLARWLLHRIRLWDQVASQRVDLFVANSAFVARRIEKVYRRHAVVVPPPVDVERLAMSHRSEPFFLVVSRLVPYKRVDLIVQAFVGLSDLKLVVIGDGPERQRVAAQAQGAPNISLLGHQPDEVVRDHLRRCRAFIIAAVEDFGIAPLEAQACGKPVIALRRGGAAETLAGLDAPVPTAVFFERQEADNLREAVRRFEAAESDIRAEDCRARAERYTPERFREAFSALIDDALGSKDVVPTRRLTPLVDSVRRDYASIP